ncbi:MAG: hypothetical protein ABSD98_08365 [Candidatus Korobacteraceae bacterium]
MPDRSSGRSGSAFGGLQDAQKVVFWLRGTPHLAQKAILIPAVRIPFLAF